MWGNFGAKSSKEVGKDEKIWPSSPWQCIYCLSWALATLRARTRAFSHCGTHQ